MEVIFNIANLKSAITFIHLAGLALGVGGAWILDGFIIKHYKSSISTEKFEVIKFVSKFVLLGLALLWVSGLLFVAYYYKYTPEFLANQKVWGKLFIVVILTVNGLLVHNFILPKVKLSIGKNLLSTLTNKEVCIMTMIGATSFLSWLFPIVIGVTKTLNFTVSSFDIIGFYLISLCIVNTVVYLISNKFININKKYNTQTI